MKSRDLKRLIQLQANLKEAIKKHDYIKSLSLQKEINALSDYLREEKVTLSTMVQKLDEKQKDRIMVMMNKLFVMADLLHGYTNDFFSALVAVDPTLQDIPLCTNLTKASRMFLSSIKLLSEKKDETYVENFQSMSDEIDYVIGNITNKYYQRGKNVSK